MAELEFELKTVNVSDVRLDPENPRFIFQRELKGSELTEGEMENIILGDDETKFLMKSLAAEGVKDPVWLKTDPDQPGKYIVIEGNRRTTALRELGRRLKAGKVTIPNSSLIRTLPANVYTKPISEKEALLQRARLQTGKAPWGRFNEAAVAYQLHNDMFLSVDDIATELQISRSEVKKRMDSYTEYKKFISKTGVDKPSLFSFFAEMPRKVSDWVTQDPANEQEYFGWIKGGQISSTTTRGGLRELPMVLEDPEALAVLRSNGKTLADAVKIVEQKNVEMQMPLLKRVKGVDDGLRAITLEELEEFKKDPAKRAVLKSLKDRIEDVLRKSSSGA